MGKRTLEESNKLRVETATRNLTAAGIEATDSKIAQRTAIKTAEVKRLRAVMAGKPEPPAPFAERVFSVDLEIRERLARHMTEMMALPAEKRETYLSDNDFSLVYVCGKLFPDGGSLFDPLYGHVMVEPSVVVVITPKRGGVSYSYGEDGWEINQL